MLENLKKQLRKLNKTKEQWEETRTYIQVHFSAKMLKVSQNFTTDNHADSNQGVGVGFFYGSTFLLSIKPLRTRKQSGRSLKRCAGFWWRKRDIG